MTGNLSRYLDASATLATSSAAVAELETSAEVEAYHRQLALLRRRLLAEPRAFRDVFIADGMQAVAWEFRQGELGADFTRALWAALSRDDDASTVLMRFIWDLPLGKKRMFIRALDAHLADRYPMFDGLSVDWPAGNAIPPYVRDAEPRPFAG